MKFEDDSQNLRARLRTIQLLILILLAALGVRLYYLQVMNGGYYSERAENQRIRLLLIPAPRGAIFDRNGKLLVDSRSIYNIILSREDLKGLDLSSLIEPLSNGLAVDPEYLRERFDEMKSQPAFESVTIKESAGPADIAWVEAHSLEFPALRVEERPQRRYPENGVLAHVLGYVGEISPKAKVINRATSSDKMGWKRFMTNTYAGATVIAKSLLTVAVTFKTKLKGLRRNRVKTL
jgi:penicillin-binding protein 2